MSEDLSDTRRDTPGQKDKFIPPPMDPYATYQTPYERRQSPEPNPFIEFRRFADKQFSDMFSGLQTFANFPKIFGVEDGMKDLKEQLERDLKEMMAFQKARMEEMDVRRARKHKNNDDDKPFLAATPATSLSTPSINNSLLERTVAQSGPKAGSENSEKWYIATGADGKQWRIDPSSGLAIPKQPDVQMPSLQTEEQDDRRTRWKRGFRNCPELKKYRGETELDMYDSYEDLHKPRRTTDTATKEKPSWSSWLPAYGYDGLQKSKMASQSTPDTSSRQGEEVPTGDCDIKSYRMYHTLQMDPLKNDHDFMPWITLSPYSPVFLANPGTAQLKSVTMHNGCEGGCDRPLQLHAQQAINSRFNTDRDIDLRNKLSDKVPWAEAFEDLLSLERTGKMPDRDPNRCPRPRHMTENWVCDLVKNGILGPNWWLQDGLITRDSRNDPKPMTREERREARKRIKQRLEESNKEVPQVEEPSRNLQQLEETLRTTMIEPFVIAIREGINSEVSTVKEAKATSNPSHDEFEALRKEYEEYKRQSQESLPTDVTQAARLLPDKEKTREAQLHPVNHDSSTNSGTLQHPSAQTAKPKLSIISSLTTMTSRTLPDGSVETKRVLKKRFADGNEESEESTEIVYPQKNKSSPEGGASKQEKRQGWFWT